MELTQVSHFAEVRKSETTGQKSLYATLDFEPGDVIHTYQVQDILLKPNYLSIQHNDFEHLMLNPHYLHWIDHSCEPNAFFDLPNRTLICIQSIAAGDKLTFFYPSTDWDMIQPFECHCKADNCLGSIQGANYIQQEVLSKYKLSTFVQSKLRIS